MKERGSSMLEYLIVTVFVAIPLVVTVTYIIENLKFILNTLDFLLKIPVL